MITDRFLETRDMPLLALSLAKDEAHRDTEPDFFTRYGSITKVYEDELGPICFVNGSKVLRLDIQYVDNADRKRNLSAMMAGFEKMAAKAKQHGFTEIIFQTNNPILKRFCEKAFGFIQSNGELRKFI